MPTSPSPGPLAPFGSEMTIAFAAAGRDALIDALCTADGDLQLDLAAVEECDSAGVQLLLSARRTLAERGACLRIVRASTAVRDALAVFGLADLATGDPR